MACEAKWNWAREPEDRLPASRVTCDSVVCKRERFSQTPTFEVECGVCGCLSFLREHRVLWRETKWWVWTIPPSYWSLSILSHAKTHMLADKKWSKSVEDVGRETRDHVWTRNVHICTAKHHKWLRPYTCRWNAVSFLWFWTSYMYQNHTHMTRFCHITRENVSN